MSERQNGLAAGVRALRAQRRGEQAVLPGQVSAAARVADALTRPVALIAAAVLVLAGGAAWFAVGLQEGPTPTSTRVVTAGEDTIEVTDGGSYEFADGGRENVNAAEGLPERALEDMQARGKDALDDGADQAAAAVMEAAAATGVPVVVIAPARISCDGEEYFDGFTVTGDFSLDSMADPELACELQRTIDGARELAQTLRDADPVWGPVAEVVELEGSAPGGTDVAAADQPETFEWVADVEPTLTAEQEQSHGGSA